MGAVPGLVPEDLHPGPEVAAADPARPLGGHPHHPHHLRLCGHQNWWVRHQSINQKLPNSKYSKI